jgi:hypothetical protein
MSGQPKGSNQGGKTGWGSIESPVQKVNQDGTYDGKSTGGVK